jgi:uncharacterized protein YndB with AHSA1/START domain
MARDRIEREIVIEAPRERVWAVLTQPEHVAQWFGDSAEIDLRPGGKAAFGWTEHGRHEAIIERADPPDFFSYRWAREAGTAVSPGAATLVEFTLSDHGSGTLLRVVETGFDSLSAPEEERTKASEQNTEGWTSELAELKEYAEVPVG